MRRRRSTLVGLLASAALAVTGPTLVLTAPLAVNNEAGPGCVACIPTTVSAAAPAARSATLR